MLLECKTRSLLQVLFIACLYSLVFCRFGLHFNYVLRPFMNSVNASCAITSWKYIQSSHHYPCLQILVRVLSNESSHESVMLYEDEDTFYKSTCSFHPQCPQKKSQEVINYMKKFGINGTTFSCYHQPNNSTNVVHTTVQWIDIFHQLFWPGLVVFLALVGFLRIFTAILCQGCWRTKLPDSTNYVPYIVDGKLRCPCQDGLGCNISCGCLELTDSDFCFYKHGSLFLGIVCKYCWRECLTSKYVHFSIPLNAPFVKVKSTELRYRPPKEAEFNTCFQGTTSRRLIDPEEIGDELTRGDHIVWHRPYGVWHHGLVADIVVGLILVIEWSSVQGCHCVVQEHMIDIETCKFWYGDMYKVTYEESVIQRNPTELVLARARSMLGLSGYGFFSRNSDSFAKFCKTGINFNHEVPCLICRLSGYDCLAFLGTIRDIFSIRVLKTVALAGMLRFALNPSDDTITVCTILGIELTSFLIDVVILHKDYGIPCQSICSYCCCGAVLKEFRKSFWMRVAEAVFKICGMIAGFYLAQGFFGCTGSSLGYTIRVTILGILFGYILGTLGKYFGCVFAFALSNMLCCSDELYDEL